MGVLKVLIVEDDRTFASYLESIIHSWNHQFVTVRTGKAALKQVWAENFDLILLDIFLPDGEGHKLIPQFKEAQPGIGVITMTGHNTPDLELEVRKHGILYFMSKPLEARALKLIVDRISGQGRPEPVGN